MCYDGDMDDTKPCPYCAETIKRAAIVCPYCHRELDDGKRIGSASTVANGLVGVLVFLTVLGVLALLFGR